MRNFKVGDRIRATEDIYGVTNLRNQWEGEVINVNDRLIDAVTTKCLKLHYSGREYYNLNPKYFKLVCQKSENFNSLYEKLNGETR